VFDYTRKRGVVDSEVFLPKGAPSSYSDRSILWNAAERAETRKNSTVAREIILALPYDLNFKSRQKLVRAIAGEIVAAHRVAIDANTHAPHEHKKKKPDDDHSNNKNDHVHLEMSTRVLNSDGFGAKTREWDDMKLGPATVKRWRARWAEMVNAEYANAGMDRFIDHRSFKDREIDRAPSRKIGVAGTAMTRSGKESERANNNIVINKSNVRIAALQAEGAAILAEMAALKERSAPQISKWHDRILNGPVQQSTFIEPAPEPPKDRCDRAAKELEYATLLKIKAEATAYGIASIAHDRSYTELVNLKHSYTDMKPPRFAMALRHLGRNAKWHEYIEKKTAAVIGLKQIAVDIQRLRQEMSDLRSSMDTWDHMGWSRHKQLADELGVEQRATIAFEDSSRLASQRYETPASIAMRPPSPPWAH
jgi:hypothetical protein